jgi:hypothetical protein
MTTASIYIYGSDLQPNIISELLGIQPTGWQIKGGRRFTDRSGQHKPAQIGIWQLKSEKATSPLSEQVEELLTKIGKRTVVLHKIQGVETAELNILVTDDSDTRMSDEIALSRIHLERLSALGLSLSLTLL